jgi:hypothetical protein
VLNKQNVNILIVLYKPVWSWENKDAISSGSATEPGGFCNNWNNIQINRDGYDHANLTSIMITTCLWIISIFFNNWEQNENQIIYYKNPPNELPI